MKHTIRLRYQKLGKVRFTSHRDVARVWERGIRRAVLPVAYSEGFNPHPKLSFGLALSTGHESLGEYLDIDLVEPVELEALPARLNPCLPVGIDVQVAAEVAPGTPSLQQAVTSCTWRIEVTGLDAVELAGRVERLLAADELIVTRERKGQQVTDDLRPPLLSLDVEGPTANGSMLVAELATQPRGFRPSELIDLLGADADEGRVCRVHQWITADGARDEPLGLATAATTAAYAALRAS